MSLRGGQHIDPYYGYIANAKDSALIFDKLCKEEMKKSFKDLIFDHESLFET